jgi:ligand-binding sensor domain-containing protein
VLNNYGESLKILASGMTVCLVCICTLSTSAYAKGKYEEGDWVSYSVFRYVTSIAMDYDHVYFGTTGGVTRYDRFDHHWETPLTTSDGLPDNWIRNLAYDPERDEIWADTYVGPAFYQRIFGEWSKEYEFPKDLSRSDTSNLRLPDFFTDFGPTSAGSEWVMDSHLDRYPITNYLRDDFDDRLWVGTWGLNAGVASLLHLWLNMLKFGLYDSDVKAILIDGDDLWFGGTGRLGPSSGITRYNRKSETWEYFSSEHVPFLTSHQINVMYADSNYVWLGTQNGLARMKKKNSTWRFYNTFRGLPDNEVTALELDGNYLWIGTTRGLAVYHIKSDSLRTINDPLLADLYIFSVLSDPYYVWVGTNRGAYTLDKEKNTWYRFVTPDGLLYGQVRSIARKSGRNPSEAKDEIWFGTDLGILGYRPMTDKTEVYHNQVNFPEVDVIKVACDKKNVWVATTHGVWKLNRSTDIWVKYTTEDGLLDNNVQDMVLDGDHIWFGTPQGATRFYWNNPRLRE